MFCIQHIFTSLHYFILGSFNVRICDDGYFNDMDNYVNYRVVNVVLHEGMSCKKLEQTLVSNIAIVPIAHEGRDFCLYWISRMYEKGFGC